MSLLIAACNVLTGTRAAPASHNMPPLCRLVFLALANRADNETRLYGYGSELIEADTGLNAATVRKCIAELLAHGHLIARGWNGPRNVAARLYEVRMEGSPWSASPTRVRETPAARRARLASSPGGTPESAPSPDDGPRPHPVATRAATRRHPASSPGGDNPPDLPPDLPPNKPPIVHVRAHVGGGDQPGQRTIPFGPSQPAPATGTPIPKSGKRPKAPGELTAAERYLRAFVEGLELGGRRITLPRVSDGALLGRIAAAHARAGGAPIVGEALLAWVRNAACRFARAITRPEVHRGGISVFGLQTWLDNGAPAQQGGSREDDELADWDLDPAPDFHERPPPRPPAPRPEVSPEQTAAALEWARKHGFIPPAPIGTPPPREPRERAHG